MGDTNNTAVDEETDETTTEGSGTDDNSAQSAETENTDESKKKDIPYTRFKEVNDQLVELKAWKAKQEKAEADRQTAEEKAEADRLAEQKEFEQLAEKRQAKLDKLEPVLKAANEKLERYETALTAHLEAQRKDLPKHIIDLLDKLDVVEQLEYIAANRDDLVKRPDGVPPSPNGADGANLTEEAQQEAQQREQRRTQRSF